MARRSHVVVGCMAGRRVGVPGESSSAGTSEYAAVRDLMEVTTSVLEAAAAHGGPDTARTAPLVLVARDYCQYAAAAFVERCNGAGRALRPSDSFGLEASRLLVGFSARTGWSGQCIVLVNARGATRHGLLWATAVVESGGADHALFCEVTRCSHVGCFLVSSLALSADGSLGVGIGDVRAKARVDLPVEMVAGVPPCQPCLADQLARLDEPDHRLQPTGVRSQRP